MLHADRKSYEVAYASEPTAPLYSAPWWLDATCGQDGWDVLKGNGDPSVLIPYHQTRIRGMKASINPPLTQWLPVLNMSDQKGSITTDMIGSLTDTSVLDISLKPIPGMSLNEVRLPVHVKYTYLIPAGNSIEMIRGKYNEGLRRNLKEANQTYTVSQSDDVESLLQLCRSTYQQRGIKMPPWFESVIPRVYKALHTHNSGFISFVKHEGKIIAGVLIGFDKSSAYYLAGGRSGDEGGASAHALLLDQAIADAAEKGLSFDFEGSMQPGIANFFQSFGAVPSPYWHIRKLRGMARIWGILHA